MKTYRDGRLVVYPQHQQCPPIDFHTYTQMRACTGCTELVDGQNVYGYPRHAKYGCLVGSGCHECKGRGTVKEYSPYPYLNPETGKLDLELVNNGW